MLQKILDWFIPLTCIVCGFQSTKSICCDCLMELPWVMRPCLTCSTELPDHSEIKQCGECLIDPPPFDRLLILFHYQFPITSLITKLKFQQKLRFAYPLGQELGQKIRRVYSDSNLPLPECIIPIPLFKQRLRKRGFNQALEIARPLKKMLNLPIDYKSIVRVKNTAPQTLLPASDRKLNVKNAFKAVGEIHLKHVAIIDDVVTTMGTLAEVAKVLRSQGVERVDAWCIARAGVL